MRYGATRELRVWISAATPGGGGGEPRELAGADTLPSICIKIFRGPELGLARPAFDGLGEREKIKYIRDRAVR